MSGESEMVRRCIDAIARDSRGLDPAEISGGGRAVWRRDVEAVITAMREPTEAMLADAWQATRCDWTGCEDDLLEPWRSAIDIALAEKKQTA